MFNKILSEAGGRALSKIISKFKKVKEINFKTFTKLFDACVWPILAYDCSVWGHNNYANAEVNL